jgi:hypothetical protein
VLRNVPISSDLVTRTRTNLMVRTIWRNVLRSVIAPSYVHTHSGFSSRLTDKRRPDALPALRRTPAPAPGVQQSLKGAGQTIAVDSFRKSNNHSLERSGALIGQVAKRTPCTYLISQWLQTAYSQWVINYMASWGRARIRSWRTRKIQM